jgi:hypothetical protein
LERRLESVNVVLVEAAASVHGSQTRAVLAKKTTDRDLKRQVLATLRAQEAALRDGATVGPDRWCDR